MANKTVGIGEWIVSSDPADIIKTYALGSCVAVLVYDSKVRVAGMIHVALPDSAVDPERAKSLPGYFADTGLPVMIEEMKRLGDPLLMFEHAYAEMPEYLKEQKEEFIRLQAETQEEK